MLRTKNKLHNFYKKKHWIETIKSRSCELNGLSSSVEMEDNVLKANAGGAQFTY